MATALDASDPAGLLRQLETAAQILLASFSKMQSCYVTSCDTFLLIMWNYLFDILDNNLRILNANFVR